MNDQLSRAIKSALLASAAGTVLSVSFMTSAVAQTPEQPPEEDEIVVTGIKATVENALGQNISNPNLRGSNPFGVFDSAIFNGVDVEKSFTAQSLSGGLAANVNLKLKSALERDIIVTLVV